jgi:Fe2+ or Zn2+ uptake regulation protein
VSAGKPESQKKKKYLTPQRRAILNALESVVTHPSADVIYEMVRKELPRISMGTVYRNLEQMATEGMILRLDGGGQKRYDGNSTPHLHFRCLCCNAMIDLPMNPHDDIQKIVQTLTDFEIKSYEVIFTGLCPECKLTKKKEQTA